MKRKAFTLIELLVVISIIALLLSILMPALTKVKDQARVVVCKSNLRQLTLAFETYRVANDDKQLTTNFKISTAPDVYDKHIWPLVIAPYMGDDKYYDDPSKSLEGVMKVIKCPSTRGVDPSWKDVDDPGWDPYTDAGFGTEPQYDWRNAGQVSATGNPLAPEGSYGVNTWVVGMDPEYQVAAKWVSESVFRSCSLKDGSARPSTPVIADSSWFEGLPMDPIQADSVPGYRDPMYPDKYPDYKGWYNNDDRGMTRFAIDRHSLAANIGFVDGHVDKVDIEDMWKIKWNKSFRTTNDKFILTPTSR